jgi:hypothetical protein
MFPSFQVATNATDVLRQLLPAGGGGYLNEADVFETDPVGTSWGRKNYERLVGIKEEVDPVNL